MIYTRSELYKIQKIGGALVRPINADYPEIGSTYSYDSVLYGDSLLVEFNFEPNIHNKFIRLPAVNWYNHNNSEVINGTAQNEPKLFHVYDN